MASISGADAEKNVIVSEDRLLFSSLEKVAYPLSVQNHIVIRSSDRVPSPQLREKVRMRGDQFLHPHLLSSPVEGEDELDEGKYRVVSALEMASLTDSS